MKKYFLLFVALLLFPTIAFAEVKEIGQADLAAAKLNPGVTTEKGITFTDGGYSNRYYYLATGEYKLTENITFPEENHNAAFYIDNATVTLDLNGNGIKCNYDHGPLQGQNSNVTIKGEGSLEGYSSEGIYLQNSNLTIVNGMIAGMRVETTETQRYGKVHIINGYFDQDIELNNLEEIIIDSGTFKRENEFNNAGSVTINGGEFNHIDDVSIIGFFGESFTINSGNFGGDTPVSLTDINNIEINGGNFVGKNVGLGIQAIPYEEFTDSNVSLKGGTFKATGDEAFGAIAAVTIDGVQMNILNDYIAEGFAYSSELQIKEFKDTPDDGMVTYGTQNEISVIHSPYAVIDGDGQTINLDEDFTLNFEFSTILNEFLESGEIYIDGKLVDTDNYVATEGSTIITFLSDFIKTIGVGEHEVTLMTDYGDVTATYTAIKSGEEQDPKDEEEKEIPDDKKDEITPSEGKSSEDKLNPKTVDNIVYYVLTMIISWTAIMGIKLYKRN